MAHNQNGEEILDQTPVNVPLGFKRPMTLNERMKQMVREEASRIAQEHGAETFEEADDFNISDDPIDPTSPWEEDFDPETPFIGAKEEAIKHGVTKDLDESKIHAGYQELEKHKYKQSTEKPKKYVKRTSWEKKPSPKEMSEVGDEQSFQEEQLETE